MSTYADAALAADDTVPQVQTQSDEQPLLIVEDLCKSYGTQVGCRDISFSVWPGEVVALVGESGSGKTTVLNCISGRLAPSGGSIRVRREHDWPELYALDESVRRRINRTEWGFVHQNPSDGLRMHITAGANIGERLMAVGQRHYGEIRRAAMDWLCKVEIDINRMDDLPLHYSGGMRQRLQIARNLVTAPSLVFMDEPTGGLDVSVQARLLDLIKALSENLDLAVVLVTHDLAIARLLSQKLLVMKQGSIVEQGLTDRVLDDPQDPYTQLLCASVLVA